MMKKITILSALLFVLLSVVSCSKDDNSKPAKEIEKTYSDVVLTLNGRTKGADNITASISAVDNTNAKLTLSNIVNGYPSYDINVVVTEENGIYKVVGSNENNGMRVSFSGTVEGDKLSGDLVIEILFSDILKNWTYYVNSEESMDFAVFELQNTSGKCMWNGEEIPVEEFNVNVKTWIDLIASMTITNPQLSFKNNGVVSFSAVLSEMLGSANPNLNYPELVRYTYATDKNQLIFDISLPSTEIKADNSSSPIQNMIQYLPFNCTFSDNKFTAILDESVVKALAPLLSFVNNDEFLSIIDSKIPPHLAMYAPIFKQLIKDIAAAITASDFKSLKLGGNLMEYKAS